MRTLEHVHHSRVVAAPHHPQSQRDPLNFIAPSSPYTLLLSAPRYVSDRTATMHEGMGGRTSPLPIWKAEMAAARQIARRLAPPSLSPASLRRTSEGSRAGQAFELPFVPRLINFHARHNRRGLPLPPPPLEGERKYVAMRKGREGKEREEGARIAPSENGTSANDN